MKDINKINMENDENQDDIYKDFNLENENNDLNNDMYKDYLPKENQEEFVQNTNNYENGNFESHIVKTKKGKFSGLVILGFYAMVLVVGIISFIMIRSDKYEFYIKKDEITIGRGGSYQVELTPKSEKDFDYLNYNYKIADESIAKVDEFGTVTAVGVGETTLEISLNFGMIDKKMKIVTIDEVVNNVNIMSINGDGYSDVNSLRMKKNETKTIKCVVNGHSELNSSVNYSSNNNNVAEIDEFGNISSKNSGTAVITCTKDGFTDSISVTVESSSSTTIPATPKPTPTNPITPKPGSTATPTPKPTPANPTTPKPGNTSVKVTKVSLGANQITKYVGETLGLSLNVTPSNAKASNISWSSSNSGVASVDQKGIIKTLKKGTAIITVNVDGIKASCTIVVKEKSSSTPATAAPVVKPQPIKIGNEVTISTNSVSISNGGKQTFTINVTGAAGVINVSSSNTSVATVTASGGDCNDTRCFFDAQVGSNSTITYTINGIKSGSANIKINLEDLYSYNEKQLTGSGTILVQVK